MPVPVMAVMVAVPAGLKAAKEIRDEMVELNKGTAGFGNRLLGKKNILIRNSTGGSLTITVDKDIPTDSGGTTLKPGEMDMYGRSGPTRVSINGKSAGNLVPGKNYSLESDGKKLTVVGYD